MANDPFNSFFFAAEAQAPAEAPAAKPQPWTPVSIMQAMFFDQQAWQRLTPEDKLHWSKPVLRYLSIAWPLQVWSLAKANMPADLALDYWHAKLSGKSSKIPAWVWTKPQQDSDMTPLIYGHGFDLAGLLRHASLGWRSWQSLCLQEPDLAKAMVIAWQDIINVKVEQ